MELNRYKQELAAARLKDGVHLPVERYDEMMAKQIEDAAAVKAAEEQVRKKEEEMMELARILNITEKELKSTMAELASTQEELSDTIVVLDVRETDLSVVGDKATTSTKVGTAASGDVTSLHSKVARKVSLLERNVSMTNTLKISTKSSIGELVEDIEQAHNNRITGHQEVLDTMRLALERQAEEHEQLLNSLASLQKQQKISSTKLHENLSISTEGAKKLAREEEKTSNETWTSVRATLEEQSTRMRQALAFHENYLGTTTETIEDYVQSVVTTQVEEMRNKMLTTTNREVQRQEELVSTLRVELEETRKVLATTQAEQVALLEEKKEHYVETHRQTMVKVRSETNEIMERRESDEAERKKQMLTHADETKAEMLAMQEKMMEMVASFAAAQQEKVASMTRSAAGHSFSMAERVEESMVALEKSCEMERVYVVHEMVEETKKRTGETMEMMQGCYGKMTENMSGEVEATKKEWIKVGAEAETWCNAMTVGCEEFVTTTEEEKKTCEKFLFKNVKWEKKSAEDASTMVEGAVSKEKERTAALESAADTMLAMVGVHTGKMNTMLTSSAEELNKSMVCFAESVCDDVTATKEFVEGAMSKDVNATGKLIQASKEMDSLVSGHVLEMYAPTGMTPAKREYTFPSPVGKMMPREVVLAVAKGDVEEEKVDEVEKVEVVEVVEVVEESSVATEESLEEGAAGSEVSTSSWSSESDASSSESGSAQSSPVNAAAVEPTDSVDIELVEDNQKKKKKKVVKKKAEKKVTKKEDKKEEEEVIVKKTRSRRGATKLSKRVSGIPRAKRALSKPLAEKN